VEDYFSDQNTWGATSIDHVLETRNMDLVMDTELILHDGSQVSVNVTVVPLINIKPELIGVMLVLDDITQEKRIKRTLTRYMTKEVAEKLLEGGETMLGGQVQVASVLFSDIRDFTAISEKIGARETVSMLNDYFSIMVDIIFRYGGILDKYIGDAIMAVFGAPFSSGNDADRVVGAAVDMLKALKELNHKMIDAGKPHINIGIGISTDEIVSGNIGSPKRMDYTVIGDGVNLASRLEGANKYYRTNILISEPTLCQLQNAYIIREIDYIRVKGKQQPVSIYEILDHYDRQSFPHLKQVIALYREGLACYRHRRWEEGITSFKDALSLHPRDGACQVFLERCQYFLHHPPEDAWDGIWVMESK
jgi:adenylate cyclase